MIFEEEFKEALEDKAHPAHDYALEIEYLQNELNDLKRMATNGNKYNEVIMDWDKEREELKSDIESLKKTLNNLINMYWSNQTDDPTEGFISCITPSTIPHEWRYARWLVENT